MDLDVLRLQLLLHLYLHLHALHPVHAFHRKANPQYFFGEEANATNHYFHWSTSSGQAMQIQNLG